MSPRPRLARPSLTIGRIYSRSQLLALGLPERDLSHCGVVTRVFRDRYLASASPIDTAARARAALTLLPGGSLIDGVTAARLWGGTTPDGSAITASVPMGATVRIHGIDATERTRLDQRPRRQRRGIALCDPATAFTDCAGRLGLVDLVVLGDSLIKAGRITPFDLIMAAEEMTGRHRRLARQAAHLCRPGVDSPPETRTRLLLVLAGLPEPTPNVIIRRDDGSWERRHDLGWEAVKVAGEYDGRQHAESTSQWRHDIRRREDSDSDGWRLVLVTAEDLYVTPEQTLRRFVAVLRQRGMNARICRDEWRRYFPGRSAY